MLTVRKKYQNRDFSVLYVDCDDARRGAVSCFLQEAGFETLQGASAYRSAAIFAEFSPPHIAIISIEDASEIQDVEEFIKKLWGISRETLVILVCDGGMDEVHQSSFANAVEVSQKLKSCQTVWEVLKITWGDQTAKNVLYAALERACQRLYFQFETEQTKDHLNKLTPPNRRDARAVWTNAVDMIQKMSRARDLESIIRIGTQAFSFMTDGRPVLYLRWLEIRQVMVVQHVEGNSLRDDLKGLAVSLSDDSLKNFIKDSFQDSEYSTVLHGDRGSPTGIFVFVGQGLTIDKDVEIEVVASLFNMAWDRQLALLNRHTVERIDLSTGLPNRISYFENLERELARTRYFHMSFSVGIISVSGMNKTTNALTGVNNSVVRVVGQALRQLFRGVDIIAAVKLGKESGRRSFALILPGIGKEAALKMVDDACRAVERLRLPIFEQIDLSRLQAHASVCVYPQIGQKYDDHLVNAEFLFEKLLDSHESRFVAKTHETSLAEEVELSSTL